MYKNILLIHGGMFSLLNALSQKLLAALFNPFLVSLITLFLLAIWNCYLTYRIEDSSCYFAFFLYSSASTILGLTSRESKMEASEAGEQASDLLLTCLDTAWIPCLPGITASQAALWIRKPLRVWSIPRGLILKSQGETNSIVKRLK